MIGLGEVGVSAKLLLALIAAGLASAVLVFIPSPMAMLDALEQAPVTEVKAPPHVKVAAMPALAAFDVLTARPLFNRDRKPDPLPPPPEAPKPAIVLGDIAQFRVEGLVVSGDSQIALVRKGGAQLLRLKPGDTLEGWKIDKIDLKGIAISGGDRSELLAIPKAENRASSR